MQYKAIFLLCAFGALELVSAQCGSALPDAYPGRTGYQPGYSAATGYPAVYTVGDIEAAGTLPVTGPVYVDGYVPVEGSVNYAGDVGATGTASVYCSCGNKWVA